MNANVPFVEIHLTSECNLGCSWCTYAHQDRTQHLHMADLDRLRDLKPEEILIAGGGEPTLYNDGGQGLDAVIHRIRRLCPNARVRLITNGTVIPPGTWLEEMAEISVSLDAENRRKFRKWKGADAFNAVMSNIETYLTSATVPKIRVTFLYDRESIEDAILLAHRLWRLWRRLRRARRLSRSKARLFAFMILPAAKDESPDRPYDDARLTPSEMECWRKRLAGVRRQRPGFWKFIRDHTNLATQPMADLNAPPARRCMSVANYVLLGADRRFYPCFRMCAKCPDHNLGPASQTAESLRAAREACMLAPPEECRRGCRPSATFYGLRSASRFAEGFCDRMLEQWERLINVDLAKKVERIGLEQSLLERGASTEKGIVWFGDRVRYKFLGDVTEEHLDSAVPEQARYAVQYNESRGWPRGVGDQWMKARTLDPHSACPFCDIEDGFTLADLERPFGVPFTLVADSRPFFHHHMLILSKTHGGGVTLDGLRDLIWLFNAVFPKMKANIGTGNQANHLHAHVFDATLPIERWRPRLIGFSGPVRISLLRNELKLTYFVLESSQIDALAGAAYGLVRQIEHENLSVCLLLARGRVYLIPQRSKTIGRRFTYPAVLDAFMDESARPADRRPRYIGPIEMAGVFLCYSRGDVPAMQQMFDTMDLPTYRHMLLETGLAVSSQASCRLVQSCKAICGESPELFSLFDPRAADAKVAGGKAGGLHALHELHERWTDPSPADDALAKAEAPPSVPPGFVLSTAVFEKVVLASMEVQDTVAALDRVLTRWDPKLGPAGDELSREIAAAAERLRQAVLAVEIPSELVGKLRDTFHSLGCNLAVRSSATIEDQTTTSAAGLARSVLNVRDKPSLIAAVKQVWASLYQDGFVYECRRLGLSAAYPRMAVILQPMVDARAAGVVMSLDPRGRAAFTISACEGIGDDLVDGGPSDDWLVSPDAKYILERRPSQPCRADCSVCMNDSEVLALAQVTRRVQEIQRSTDGSNHVDIEFALDKGGRIVLLQCRPVTAVPTDHAVQIDMVVPTTVAADVRTVALHGLCAFEGAAVGRLNVLGGEDEQRLIARVKAKDIVVTTRTTCRWNAAMEGVAGLITEEGSTVSHPAIHSREQRLPAVIGVPGVVHLLAPYHGQLVTFDSGSKTLYLAAVPIVKTMRSVSLWGNRCSAVAANASSADRQGLDRKSQPGLMSDFEGTWFPRPAVPYCAFQLEYYKQAFDWYVAFLRGLAWPSGAPKAPIGRHVLKVRNGILCEQVSEEGAPERNFMRCLTLDDFEFLVAQRWRVLDEVGAFFEDLATLDARNVNHVVEGLVKLLGVNSMGHALRTAFEEIHFRKQAQYVSPAYLPQMIGLALEMAPSRRANLDLELQKALHSLAEDIAVDAEATATLSPSGGETTGQSDAIEALQVARPHLFERLRQLAEGYKLDTEDLRVPPDPAAWLHLLRKLLKPTNSSIDMDLLARFGGSFVRREACDSHTLEVIEKGDAELYSLIRRVARASTSSPQGLVTKEAMLEVLEALRARVETDARTTQLLRSALADYPTLRRTLALAAGETLFRANFHHVITRYQRKVAALMLEAAKRRPDIFPSPEEVFEIGLEELPTLFQDTPAAYILHTPERNRIMAAAEAELHDRWPVDPAQAVEAYRRRVCVVLATLRGQIAAAAHAEVVSHYRQIVRQLIQRLRTLEVMAGGLGCASRPALVAARRTDGHE